MKTDERKKALELSRNWLTKEVGNNRSSQPDVSQRTSHKRNNRGLLIVVAVLVVGVIIIVLINNLSQHNEDKQKDPANPQSITSRIAKSFFSAASTTPSSEPAPNSLTTEQLTQNSDEKASRPSRYYPSGWPEELHFPTQFILQDANTVRTHDNALPAYAVQMGFDGDMQVAEESVSSYMEKQGWKIVGRSELDSGAIKIDVTRNGERDSGHITIDPDPLNTGKIRIVAIVFF